MKLIVGLGNPGEKYTFTRHNVGFLFLDWLKDTGKISGEFKMEKKFKAETLTCIFDGEKTIFFKPQTFMNLSGDAMREIVNFYKIDIEDIIVIYDDMSMEFEKLRFRAKGTAGGHNGIKSIIKHFGEQFNRIKVGIGYDDRYEVSDWVLSKFSNEEYKELQNSIFDNTFDLLKEKL